MIQISDVDFQKGNGLVPVIVQHACDGTVLMLGYMNEQSLQKTLDTGLVTFFSRSRNTLWCKGETSGNTLALVDLALDCDQDTILIQANPKGPTCHLGNKSCFSNADQHGLSWLESVIADRAVSGGPSSYTRQLLEGTPVFRAKKVAEEGAEVALALTNETDDRVLDESADLLYHLLVSLKARNLSLCDILSVLRQRHHAS